MLLNEYQELARSTAVYPKHDSRNSIGIPYCGLGMCGEAGEVANEIKKVIRDDGGDYSQRRPKILDEAGDVLWYLSALVGELECTLEEVAVMNLQKLARRKAQNNIQGEHS